ncbi:hypothetical protein [Crenobacter caeni]|uniref:Uncharacterized protein n=1 Tax=Crenobacter caeni TaxID=2705474 RepID=A0A6B2KQG2_9NEIS|nr:hypothetical protein [Crenobacter caeni]NDV12486.1 hypothetical protein [Crenobacter caeni]
MNAKMHTASSLPLLAEYHAALQQRAGFDDALGFTVPAVSAKEASHLESAAALTADDCADAIELLARLMTHRDRTAGDEEEIVDHMPGALRLIGSALKLANEMERTAGYAHQYHTAKARQKALTEE